MSDYILTSNGELYHYGVIGMKWGVRRGNTAKAYAKASNKLKKLDARVEKAKDKSRKATAKADKRMYGISTQGMREKSARKASKASYKAVKKARKAQRWVSKMEKTFSKTDISLTKEQQALGKKYMAMIDTRAASRY